MKLTIDREPLLLALTRTAGVVSRKAVIPILQHVMLEASDGALTLTVTDLNVQATITAPCEVATPGSTTLPADRLREICTKLPEGAQIEIDVTDPLRAEVKAGRSKFKIGALMPRDFPTMATVEGGAVLDMQAGAMLRLLTIGSACADPSYAHPCSLIEVRDGAVRVVSTNGKALTMCDAPAPKGFAMKTGTKLGVDLVALLIKALGAMPNDGPASLTIAPGKMLAASLGGMNIVGRVLDGDYPPYLRVVPARSSDVLTVDTDTLIAMMERARIATDHIFIDLKAGRIEIEGRDQATGDTSEEGGECDWDGAERRLAVSAPRLLALLALVGTESVTMQINDPMMPVNVSETGKPDWSAVVMPMIGSK